MLAGTEAGKVLVSDHSRHGTGSDEPSRKPNSGAPKMKFRREHYVVTYAELEQRALDLAREILLRSTTLFVNGGDSGQLFVAICLERTVALAVALIGVLMAGAAYVPLEPSHPGARLRFVLDDANAQLLVTCWCARRRSLLPEPNCIRLAAVSGKLLNRLSFGAREQACNASLNGAPVRVPCPMSSDRSLAYLLYTSGSTGVPKGVLVHRLGVLNQLYHFDTAVRQEHPLLAGWEETLLALATIVFDIAALELLWPLCFGFQVFIASSTTRRSPPRLAAILNGNACGALGSRPTILQATPVTWRGLVHVGWQGHAQLAGLCSGDTFPSALLGPLHARCGRGVWNVYGPTETTVWCTAHRVSDGTRQHEDKVPIGTPISNMVVALAATQADETEAGAGSGLQDGSQLGRYALRGELIIGGVGLTRGYHRRPELTASNFVRWDFDAIGGGAETSSSNSAGSTSATAYRSGDVVLQLEGSLGPTLKFVGRLDFQVKFRGFRIELGEIEHVLERHPQVHSAACVLRNTVAVEDIWPQSKEERQALVAFVQLQCDGSLDDASGCCMPMARDSNAVAAAAEDIAADFPSGTNSESTRMAALRAAAWAASVAQQQTRQAQSPPTEIQAALKAFLAAQLPAHMVPRYVTVLPALPLSVNGKIDRKALRATELLSGGDHLSASRTPAAHEKCFGVAPSMPDTVETASADASPARDVSQALPRELEGKDWAAEGVPTSDLVHRNRTLRSCVVAILAEVTGIAVATPTALDGTMQAHELDKVGAEREATDELAMLGVDSITATALAESLSQKVLKGNELSAEVLFSHRTVDSLCDHLAGRLMESSQYCH